MNKRLKLFAVLLMSFVCGMWIVWPTAGGAAALQVKTPDKVVLNPGGKPGEVTFNHKAHEPRADKGKGCVECHHKNTNAQLKTEKPAKCETCHMAKGNAKNPKVAGKEIWTQEAFHTRCQGCHKAQNKGPVKCMECHVKKA